MKRVIASVLFVAAAFACAAQTTVSAKTGYANVDYIFNQLPAAKQIESELKSMQTQLRTQVEAKGQDLQKKYDDYNRRAKTMTDTAREKAEKELQTLHENFQKFQQDAQLSLQTKQNQLVEPVYTKISKAIEDVAKENGFLFIFNRQGGALDGVVLYADKTNDVSDLVLRKLGVTPKPPAPDKKPN